MKQRKTCFHLCLDLITAGSYSASVIRVENFDSIPIEDIGKC
jgi:hypothetical protein